MDHADIVLFTANDFETRETQRAFGDYETVSRNGRSYWDYGQVGGARVVHALTNMADLAAGKSAKHALGHWDPALLVAVGIAWGCREDDDEEPQRIGDLLLAHPLRDAATEKVSAEKGTQPRGDFHAQDDAVLQVIKTSYWDWTAGETDESKPRLYTGLVLSRPTLVDDAALRATLLNAHPGAIGGEMEGRGMVSEAVDAKCDWVLLKAICDWGKNKNAVPGEKARDQELAARNAAQFLRYAIGRGLGNFATTRPQRPGNER